MVEYKILLKPFQSVSRSSSRFVGLIDSACRYVEKPNELFNWNNIKVGYKMWACGPNRIVRAGNDNDWRRSKQRTGPGAGGAGRGGLWPQLLRRPGRSLIFLNHSAGKTGAAPI